MTNITGGSAQIEHGSERIGHRQIVIPVSVNKNTPLDKKTGGEISFQQIKSGAGLQFLLPDCKARACTKGVFCSDTGIVKSPLYCLPQQTSVSVPYVIITIIIITIIIIIIVM